MAISTRVATGLVASLLLLTACSNDPVTPGPASTTITGAPNGSSRPPISATESAPVSSPEPSISTTTEASDSTGELSLSTIATDLAVPWGLDFLPNGQAVITGRDDASISTVDQATGAVSRIGTIEGVDHGGEGGLLGVAVSPSFAQDGLLYVYFTGEDGNQIDTVELQDAAISNQQVVFDGIPKAGNHNGGRIAFGPDGLLYVGTGDAGERPNSQDLASLGGKILRLSPDGSPAPGNPFPDAPYVYSYGHRNVQGLAFDDAGRLWAAEFGQNTWDELNLITAGGNYGWPEVEGKQANDGFIAPERVWPTDQASPSGIAFWQGSIWMAGLRGERLWQIPIIEADATTGEISPTGEPIAHLANVYGRLRTVAAAPDGSLWLSTSNTDGRGDVRQSDDLIMRIVSVPAT